MRSKKKENKRNHILKHARQVFSEKGYSSVTMTDIIDASKISRGGVYLYFSSVEEIFINILTERSSNRFSEIKKSIENDEPFETILYNYLSIHKKRLLHDIDDGILRAIYEYYFIDNTNSLASEIQNNQFKHMRETIFSILNLGIKQKKIHSKNIQELSEHFVFTIEGLNILALNNTLKETQINEQFNLLVSLL